MYCSKCGTHNDENNYRCSSCGQVLPRTTDTPPPQPVPQPPQFPNKIVVKKGGIGCGGFILLVIGLIFLAQMCDGAQAALLP